MKTILGVLLVLVVVSMIFIPVQAKSKDSKAKDKIIKAIGKAVEGKYSTIKLIQLSKSNVSGYVIAYNTTKSTPPLPPPNPEPSPQPTPTGNVSKVAMIGDISGTSVRDLIQKSNPNLVVALGDLGYKSDLSSFKKNYGGSFKNLRCVIGNHDATEDGSSALYKEALAYCGDHWSLKIGKSTLLIGMNTNGDIPSQVSAVKQYLTSDTMIKTVILLSHKAGHVPPNSHHPAEASNLYKQLEQLIPTSVKLIEIAGHNHVSSSAPSKNWYQAGAGGKSFYSCGTDAVWTFCDNKSEQYLELTIDNANGNTAAKFIK